jgi:hypothetical protein
MYGKSRPLSRRACEVALKLWLLEGLRMEEGEAQPRTWHRSVDARSLADETVADEELELQFEALRHRLPPRAPASA